MKGCKFRRVEREGGRKRQRERKRGREKERLSEGEIAREQKGKKNDKYSADD